MSVKRRRQPGAPVTYRGALLGRRLFGIVVLALAVLSLWLAWGRPSPFASSEIVRADISDADGLAAIGADVRVAGVPVGRVTGITRAGNVAQLRLTLDPSAGIVHRDATISLRPRLLFEGTAYVELALGSPSAPELGDRVLPSSQASTYVPLDDVLSVLNSRTRPNVRAIAATGASLLSGAAPARLRDAISDAPDLTRDAAVISRAAQGPHATELRSAVESCAGVASTVASRSPALRGGLKGAERTLTALNTGAGQPLANTLEGLPHTSSELIAGADSASRIMTGLQGLIPHLDPGVRELAPTITAVRPLLRRAVPVARDFTPVLGQVQDVLGGATRSAAPALTATAAMQPTLEIFQHTLLSALEKRTDLGDPAYLAFLGLFAGGGGASRPFGVDGRGHFMRFGLRFLTGVGLPLPPCTLLSKVSPLVSRLVSTAGGCTS